MGGEFDPATANGETSPGETGVELDSLRAQLAEKDKEIAELKDKYLRTLADSENARKRIRQQSEESIRIQREAILRDLLPIIDNLERALAAAARNSVSSDEVQRIGNRLRGEREEDAALKVELLAGQLAVIAQGVAMVLRLLIDFLRAQGVTQVQSVGQPFDPNRHEAVDHVASDAHPPNTVVDEFHRGYLIGERTLRPARVSVAKDTGTDSGRRNRGETDASDVENN